MTWHTMGMQLGRCLTKRARAVAEFVDIDGRCACRCALVVVKLAIAHIRQPVAYANPEQPVGELAGGISIRPSATYLVGLPLAGPPLGCFNPSTPPLLPA